MSVNKKVRMITLGCKVNQYESEKIRAQFVENGYTSTEDDEVDVCIINSCTVTHIADKKTRSTIRKIKRTNPKCIVVVTGCYVQTNIDELMTIAEIDILVDNTGKERLFELVSSQHSQKCIVKGDIFKELEYTKSGKTVSVQEQTRGFIKIQDGCNNFCSYCKIPFARGRSRSRNLDEIVIECQELADKGYKEVVVIGINLSQYGLDIEEKTSFLTVLKGIAKIEGIERIRIGSIYPEQITSEFIEFFFNNSKMMPHIHLSLQSCSDSVLKGMNRHYSVSEIEEKIAMLNTIDHMRITADIIVGFPSEGEREFEEGYHFLECASLSECHVFPYSKREKTKAYDMIPLSNTAQVSERVEYLLSLSKKKMGDFCKTMIGIECRVLIEKCDKEEAIGYSENYVKVKVLNLSPNYSKNSVVKVKIVGVQDSILMGEMI